MFYDALFYDPERDDRPISGWIKALARSASLPRQLAGDDQFMSGAEADAALDDLLLPDAHGLVATVDACFELSAACMSSFDHVEVPPDLDVSVNAHAMQQLMQYRMYAHILSMTYYDEVDLSHRLGNPYVRRHELLDLEVPCKNVKAVRQAVSTLRETVVMSSEFVRYASACMGALVEPVLLPVLQDRNRSDRNRSDRTRSDRNRSGQGRPGDLPDEVMHLLAFALHAYRMRALNWFVADGDPDAFGICDHDTAGRIVNLIDREAPGFVSEIWNGADPRDVMLENLSPEDLSPKDCRGVSPEDGAADRFSITNGAAEKRVDGEDEMEVALAAEREN